MTSRRTSAFSILPLLFCGCYQTFEAVGDGGRDLGDAAVGDAVVTEADGGGRTDTPAPIDSGLRLPEVEEPPPGAVVCGGAICGAGETCCHRTALCTPAGDPSCAAPSGVEGGCARSSDCGAAEHCTLPPERCGGVTGVCVPLPTSGCEHFAPVCGCDGRTYFNRCAAAEAGTPVAWPTACGAPIAPGGVYGCEDDDHCPGPSRCEGGACVFEETIIACGIDAQCPEGEVCCAITGTCHDPSVPGTCVTPPDPITFPCADDETCARYDGSFWGAAHSATFCDAPSCDGPGGCRYPEPSCDGVLAPVCGCDGVTYQNACEAGRAHVRVASEGACE